MGSELLQPLTALDQQLHKEVFYGRIERIRALHAQGADLDSIDVIGMTPLMKAILRSPSLEMAKVLLRLGANVNKYICVLRGTALHHCVDHELEKAANLLLSHGADPCIKDYHGNTVLELARQKGLVNIVRAIEGRISLFQGWMREKYGPCSFMKRIIWAVVLPSEVWNPFRHSKLALAIYLVSENKPASKPRAVIELWQSQIERKLNEEDPCVTIVDKETEYRYEILSVDEGDKQKLLQFYDACRGIAQVVNMDPADSPIPDSLPASSSLAPSEPFASSMDDIELAMAIKASIQSAIAEGVPNVQSAASSDNMNDWENPVSNSLNGRWHPEDAPDEPPSLISSQAQVDTPSSSTYSRRVIPGIGSNQSSSSTYNRSISSSNTPSRTCVICLDAPVEGACVPCGHMAFCMPCLKDIKSKDGVCPICRATINQVLCLYQV